MTAMPTPECSSTDNEGVPEHVRVWPGDPDPRCLGESPQAAGGGVAVHPDAATGEQDWSAGAGAGCPVDRAADRGWQRDEDGLGALAAHAQHPVAVLVTQIGDVRPGGLEDAQGPAGRAWRPARSRTGCLIPGRR